MPIDETERHRRRTVAMALGMVVLGMAVRSLLGTCAEVAESALLRVGRAELAAAAGEVGGLGGVAGEFDGAVVGLAGLLAAA
jgi:hypothetical protein